MVYLPTATHKQPGDAENSFESIAGEETSVWGGLPSGERSKAVCNFDLNINCLKIDRVKMILRTPLPSTFLPACIYIVNCYFSRIYACWRANGHLKFVFENMMQFKLSFFCEYRS